MNSIKNANGKFTIKIKNLGGYISDFTIYYEVDSKQYNVNSGAFTLGFSGYLNIPSNTKYIYLKVEAWIFGYLTTVYENYISLQDHCFNIDGSIFNPKFYEITCNSSENESITNNQCSCCCFKKPNKN